MNLDQFKKITNYDIAKFFSDFNFFVGNYYNNIVNYYNGEDIDKNSFRFFDDLKIESRKIESLIDLNSDSFDNSEYWDLLDIFTNVVLKLSTIDNLGRWLRSSRIDRLSSDTIIDYIQKQNESIEKISLKSGSNDSDNNWTQLAIDNDLNEEKYSSTGGVLLKIRLKNGYNFEIRNVVDYFSNENLYGKDITNRIEFENNDIKSLSGISSLLQTVENILSTMKGSIPEFIEDGIDNDLIGSNVSIFNYPVQVRSIMNMLQKDDRFKSIELIDIVRVDDSITMKLQFTTKIGDMIKRDMNL